MWLNVFSSTGIGLLIGVLLGMSASPVVGLVVGAITALLASLLGLSLPTGDIPPEQVRQQARQVSIRAGVFGLSCLIGLFIGVFIRTHNLLSPASPGLADYYQELKAIGLDDEQARASALKKWGLDNQTPQADTSAKATDSVLFAEHQAVCEKLVVDNFASFEALSRYLHSLDAGELAAIAEAIVPLSNQDQPRLDAMEKVLGVLCAK